MKTKLILPLLLIVSISCSTNNKPVSDAQKEKIKGEVKEVVNTFIKGIEEANADMVMESFLDSPDFVDITNGMAFSYKELMAMKPNFDAILNQKCTMVNEKYTFLDKSTVLYTAETKWSTNYKDGHSSITDPQAFLIIFKKIDNRWKVIYLVDSNVEKNVPSVSSKGLNQVELMKKWIGTWKNEIGKDSTVISEFIPMGKGGLEGYQNSFLKGKIVSEEKNLWGYDKKSDKYFCARIWKDKPDIILFAFWFTSENTCERIPFEYISNPEQAPIKTIYEFKSPNSVTKTDFEKNKPVKTYTGFRIKQ
jgi:hypothetical protein